MHGGTHDLCARSSLRVSRRLPFQSSECRLDSDFVVHGGSDPLGAAEITLSGLDGYVAEKKLDLL